MIKEEHKIDTVAWLFIAVICTSVIASLMVYENVSLKQKIAMPLIKEKEYQHTIDSLRMLNDTLKAKLESSEFYMMKLQESYEDEISFLGHALDEHNIHPDYSKFIGNE